MLYAPIGLYSENPYYIKELGYNVYSIEELLFLLKENLTSLEDSIMSLQLCFFIERELNLSELGKSLTELVRNRSTLSAFVVTLFEKTGYMSKDEIKAVAAILHENSEMNYVERRKNCGDYFMSENRYATAVTEYENALSQMKPNDSAELLAAVNHNLGCAKARLGYFDEAAECFYTAYKADGNKDSKYQYLAACRLSCSKEDYIEMLKGLKDFESAAAALERAIAQNAQDRDRKDILEIIERAKNACREGDIKAFERDVNSVIGIFKANYRRNMEIE